MRTRKQMQIALVAALAAIVTVGCTPAENTNTTTTQVTATPAPTPDANAIIAEITKIENDWPRVIREKDGAAVRRFEADDVMVVYPDGSAGNKEQDIKDIEAGMITFDAWDISEMKVNVIDSNTAVATFLITVTNGKIRAPDGRTKDISGKYRVIDTFARRNAQWQLVGSGVTPLSKEAVAAAAAAATASPSPKGSPAATSSPANRATPRTAPTRRPSPPPPASPANNQ